MRKTATLGIALLVASVVLLLSQLLLDAAGNRGAVRGRMVDAGGHRVRMIVSGTDQPGPTVILECGIGGSTASSWGELEAWGPLTNPEAARTHGFGSRPLAVLTAERSAE